MYQIEGEVFLFQTTRTEFWITRAISASLMWFSVFLRCLILSNLGIPGVRITIKLFFIGKPTQCRHFGVYVTHTWCLKQILRNFELWWLWVFSIRWLLECAARTKLSILGLPDVGLMFYCGHQAQKWEEKFWIFGFRAENCALRLCCAPLEYLHRPPGNCYFRNVHENFYSRLPPKDPP